MTNNEDHEHDQLGRYWKLLEDHVISHDVLPKMELIMSPNMTIRIRMILIMINNTNSNNFIFEGGETANLRCS